MAQEVAGVLTEKGYKVVAQDYDIPFTVNFVETMHEAIKNARDLVVLYTGDYETSPYTRKEFTSFEADRAQSVEERRVIILRCEDVPLRGLFASNVYQDLVGIDDREERERRILAAAEGQSQALRPPPRPFVGVPSRLPYFIGRSEELDWLDAMLVGGQPEAATRAAGTPVARIGRVAVHGMGGVGKSALAVEYAFRCRDLYAGVWWCPAETRIGLLTSLAGLAKGIGAISAGEANLEKAAIAGLQRLAEQRATYLLIYDNVVSPEDIAELLPASGARLLVTSRFSDWSDWAGELSLDVLPLADSGAFLKARAERHDGAGAAILAEALGRLPLALDHAAAYCKRTQMRFADYAAKAERLIATAPRGVSYPRSVVATFDLAIAEAAKQHAAAELLMDFLAQCAPDRIPMMLLEGAIADDADSIEALLALGDVSLAKRDPFEDGTPAVTVHRLVQAVARARAAATGKATPAADRLVLRLTSIYPTNGYDPAAWPLCMQLTPHVLAQRDNEVPDPAAGAEWAKLQSRLATYLHGRGAYSRARPLYERALSIRQKVLGPEHPDTATSLDDLATLLHNQGELSGARPLYERALSIREKVLGPEHPDTATSLGKLATLLEAQGALAAARPLHERALWIREKVLGPEHPLTATSLDDFAFLLQGLGELAVARPLFERALSIREKALGPEHRNTARSLNNVASLLKDQGELAAARPLFERALSIREKMLGSEHPDTGRSLNNLAFLLRAQGELAAARPLHERALSIFEKALGLEHSETARSLNNLAFLLQDQGELAAARSLYERALAIFEKVLGPEHPDTATALNNLARLLQDQGELAAARPLYERALSIREKTLGPEHLRTARSLNNLAYLLQAQGELAAARQLYERALSIREKTLGPEHPDTATALNNLALLLQAQRELAAARPLHERALSIREKTLGPEHPDTARSLNNLAFLLQAQGELAAARPLYERALSIREKTLGPKHFDTAASLKNLAYLLNAQGEIAAARQLFERVAKI
jgi:tetratricopeptide (TPR) repeat protein